MKETLTSAQLLFSNLSLLLFDFFDESWIEGQARAQLRDNVIGQVPFIHHLVLVVAILFELFLYLKLLPHILLLRPLKLFQLLDKIDFR